MPDNRELFRLLQQEKFEAAFRLAESVKNDPSLNLAEQSDLLYAGCLALFGLGHIQQARSWANEFHTLQPGSARSFYLNAFIYLHARKVNDALLCLTRIIQVDPGDTFADRLISRIKRGQDRILDELDEPGALFQFVPVPSVSERSVTSNRKSLGFAIFAIVVAGIAIGILAFLYMHYTNPFTGLDERLPVVPESIAVLPADAGETDYTYNTKEQAVEDFSQARQFIQAGRVNQARVILGRIERSNADFLLRDRATLLRQSIPVIVSDYFNDPISPQQYRTDPFSYRDADVRWQGRVENLTTDESTGVQTFLFSPATAAFSVRAVYAYRQQGAPALPESINLTEVYGRFVEKESSVLSVMEVNF